MGYYVNNNGKLLIGTVIAAAAAEAVTGEDSGLARGCAIGLVAWIGWVIFFFTMMFWIIFR